MSGYYIKLGHTLRICFGTSDSTGAAADADSTPSVTILEQGFALAYAPTVTNKTTGLYEVVIDCTTPNGFEDGKEYSAYVSATVDGSTGRDGIGSFKIQTMDVNIVSQSVDVDANVVSQDITVAASVAGTVDANIVSQDIDIDANVVTIVTAAAQVIRDEILTYSHRVGRTVRGMFRRMDSFIANKALGLNSGSVSFYAPDEAIVEMTTSQDVDAGSRQTSTVTGSETP